MRCAKCQNDDTRVIESRSCDNDTSIRRRRECPECSNRFTTYERIERPLVSVIKKDGTRQSFDREKILSGILRACEKTPVTNDQVQQLVESIESSVYDRSTSEIDSRFIGELIMSGLSNLNPVAYVRFASVYRNFTDITGFEEELKSLKNQQQQRGI